MAASVAGEFSLQLYGDQEKCNALLPLARLLVFRAVQADIMSLAQRTSDGSVIRVVRNKDIRVCYIFASSSTTGGKLDADKDRAALFSGIMTDPRIKEEEVSGRTFDTPTEFTPTNKTYSEYATYFSSRERSIAERLMVKPLEGFIGLPDLQMYVQAGALAPSMYSGMMRKAVQLCMALGKPEITDTIPALLYRDGGYQVKYGCGWDITHGLVKPSDEFPWQIVEISQAGVLIGPLSTVRLAEDMGHPDTLFFGGMPSGDLPLEGEFLLTPDILAPYFEGEPLTSPMHGWVFNNSGTECRNISVVKHSDTYWEVRLCAIRFIDNDGEIEAEFEVLETARIAQPGRWVYDKFVFNRAHNDQDDINEPYAIPFGLSLRPPVQMWWSRSYHNSVIGAYNPAPESGNDPLDDWASPLGWSSWMNAGPPVQYYLHGDGIEGVATNVTLPVHAPVMGTVTEIDCPFHVSCHDDEFHTVRFYWAIDPGGLAVARDAAVEHDAARDTAGDGGGHYQGTWFANHNGYGVPPTFYTHLLDSRKPRYAATTKIDPAGWWMLTQMRIHNRPFHEQRLTYDMVGMTTRVNWLCHTELFIPFMDRCGYQLLDCDSEGGAAAQIGDTVYGTELVVGQPMVGMIPDLLPEDSGIKLLSLVPRAKPNEYWKPLGMVNQYAAGAAFEYVPTPRYLGALIPPPLAVHVVQDVVPTGRPNMERLQRTTTPWQYEHLLPLDVWALSNGQTLKAAVREPVDAMSEADVGLCLGRAQMPVGLTYDPPRPSISSFNAAVTSPVFLAGDGEELVVRDVLTGDVVPEGLPIGIYLSALLVPYIGLIPDRTTLYTYNEGLPAPYETPDVNRTNMHLMHAETVNGPTSGMSASGERFAFLYNPGRTPSITSYGFMPSGGLVFDDEDIIVPLGIMEN